MRHALINTPIEPVEAYKADLKLASAKPRPEIKSTPTAAALVVLCAVAVGVTLGSFILGWAVIEAFTVINAARLGL